VEDWADQAIEEACRRTTAWYRSLSPFMPRVNLRTVVGRKYPAIMSEQDCVMNFARFLNEAGVLWDAIHHQVWASNWLFKDTHRASKADLSKKWSVDLALVRSEVFRMAKLPAETIEDFQFDACLEFAYLSDFYTLPGAHPYGYSFTGRGCQVVAGSIVQLHECGPANP
jgi:hypothetical protein